ncbi:MAG: 2-amino-4-hydroxy-6-hydroxymethyldihydropteridine diphosphokinase [Muribaculaceae bacterium]|nr:2-amino-4-hydroxy-6-hydroxymethyldihydropteridine diphosphokinase [Muribaculaceae bacterium]
MIAHKAVLLLGSNVESRVGILERALVRVDSLGHRERVSEVCLSADVAGLGNDYANVTAVYSTEMTLGDFCCALAAIETEAGRIPSSKYTGIMPLDIDVVIWDGAVVSPDDFSRPYFRREIIG